MTLGRPKADPKLKGYPLTIRLFELQDKLEWSMKRYAEKTGMDYQRLCRIRQGNQEPSLHDLIQMAEPFGLRVTLGDIDD